MNVLRESPAVLVLALGVLAFTGPSVWAGMAVPLSDSELEAVYAGAQDESEPLPSHLTQIDATTTMTQNITGPAQQGASALILINALGSAVSAQVNLIANFGGTVGQASQANVGRASQ